MFDTIGGIPLHPLIVHGVVVLVPLASLLVLLAYAVLCFAWSCRAFSHLRR